VDGSAQATENSADQTRTSESWTAARIAANLNRNFFANNSRNANCYFVRNANGNSLANLNGLLLTYWDANGVRNFLANGFACPVADGVGAGPSFRNHSANSVAYVLDLLLANPLAGSVANGLGSALRNHLAGLVAHGLLMALRYHPASRVADRAASWLADIAANGVLNRLLMALRYHAASGVANRLLSALRNHSANSVRNCLGYTASLVTNTVDFLGFAGWNPASLADGSWWALNALNSACSGAVNASASALVPYPGAWLANNASYNRSRNFFLNVFPVSTANLDRLGVVYWRDDGTYHFASSLFLDRNHYRVVDDLFVSFTNWLHHGVVDHSLASLVNWLANGVVDHLLVSFMNWLHDRVVDDLLVGLYHWDHHCVLNFFGVVMVHGTSNIVCHLTSLGFPNWLHDGVFASASLIDRLANRLRDGSGAGLWYHPSDIDYLVLSDGLILGSHSLNNLLFINCTAYSLHYSVGRWSFTASRYTAAGFFVADRSEVSGLGSTGQRSQQGHQYRHDKQPSHLPFSLEI
jgi:hypothetical protein